MKAVERDDVVVVIDVLRCSSSIITALAEGAIAILPIKTIRKAREINQINPDYVLAGERKGRSPSGFMYGNSPFVFSSSKIGGKRIILTTTNGTLTISQAKGAKHVLIGAFLNAKTVAEFAFQIAEEEGCGVTISLSGKRGNFSLEDFLGAGAILDFFPRDVIFSDAALASLLAFRNAKNSLPDVISRGSHAKYLMNIGFDEDVRFCSQLNKYPIAPYLKDDLIVSLKNIKNLK